MVRDQTGDESQHEKERKSLWVMSDGEEENEAEGVDKQQQTDDEADDEEEDDAHEIRIKLPGGVIRAMMAAHGRGESTEVVAKIGECTRRSNRRSNREEPNMAKKKKFPGIVHPLCPQETEEGPKRAGDGRGRPKSHGGAGSSSREASETEPGKAFIKRHGVLGV